MIQYQALDRGAYTSNGGISASETQFHNFVIPALCPIPTIPTTLVGMRPNANQYCYSSSDSSEFAPKLK